MEARKPPARIDVEQDIRRTTDGPRRNAQCPGQPADKMGFSRAELTFQGDAFASHQGSGELAGDGFGLADAARDLHGFAGNLRLFRRLPSLASITWRPVVWLAPGNNGTRSRFARHPFFRKFFILPSFFFATFAASRLNS